MKKSLVQRLLPVLGLLALVAVIVLAWAPEASSQCGFFEPGVFCNMQCEFYGGLWYCSGPSNRCCYESVAGGACGESARPCWPCDCDALVAGGF